ncbi:helix-turn-helix transcriptional regulator [Telluribacter humicola]|uniref:helix-turn-helix transcriptional regulator n=1 Tax=Telluribacter humicola TaxID=1720261 RepID=UPI001A9667C5|nr:LuxR C-terminal-related transcriptional regulator [Telluribacter humicola]
MAAISSSFDVSSFKDIWRSDLLTSQVVESKDLFHGNTLLNEVLILGGTAMAIVDLKTKLYTCIYGDVDKVFGWSQQHLLDGGVAFLLERIPPGDIQAIEDMHGRIIQHIKDLSDAESKQYRAILDYRIIRPDGSLGRIIQDTLCLKRDDQGNILFLLALASDISHLKRDGRQHLRLSNGKEDLIYEVDNETGTVRQLEVLSSRELEIARLMGKKMTSEEIAGKLFLSPHTVNTHRHNMLKKLDMVDTLELINFLSVYRFI